MMNWKKVLKSIYTPEAGTLWAVPNKIWNNGFATNKSSVEFHPAIVEKTSGCNTITYIIPGTSKDYNQGSCVFKIKINALNPLCPHSYFLIKLSMPFTKESLLDLKSGWNGIEILNEKQISEFNMQLKFCKG